VRSQSNVYVSAQVTGLIDAVFKRMMRLFRPMAMLVLPRHPV
jgi:hypothetical protein